MYRNHALLLGIEDLIPRLIKLLHLNSLGSKNWAQTVISRIPNNNAELMALLAGQQIGDDGEDDWHELPSASDAVPETALRMEVLYAFFLSVDT